MKFLQLLKACGYAIAIANNPKNDDELIEKFFQTLDW